MNAADQVSRTKPALPLWLFRACVTVSFVLLFDQAVFAGQFLSGAFGALHTHRENATAAGISVLVVAFAAVLLRWPGRRAWWPIAASFGLFGLIAAQIMAGFARNLALHIPLGVTIILVSGAITAWSWLRLR